MGRMLSTLAVLLLVAGCGSSEETGTEAPPDEACVPPNRWVGEDCLAPGVQDDGCPAGTLGDGAGHCLSPGVPPELCADGFVHDGDRRCEPILPAEPCGYGLMAVPGDTACRPVMPCGTGRWGDIPVDDTTIYVDAAHAGPSDGSESQPFTSLVEAVSAAPDGALIAIAEGTYTGSVAIEKRLRIWGVCPERVLVTAADALGTLDLRNGADQSEIHGIGLSGTVGTTISVTGAEEVLVSQIWAHDAVGRGLTVQNDLGPASVTLRDSLFELNHITGVLVVGAVLDVDGVVVRDTQPAPGDLDRGQGMNAGFHPTTHTPATLTASRSLLERNHHSGLSVLGSSATVRGFVVRDTRTDMSDGTSAWGISTEGDATGSAPAALDLASSVLERNQEAGLLLNGASAVVSGVVVRDTLPRESDQRLGYGIAAQQSSELAWRSGLALHQSVIERNHDVGLFVESSDFDGSLLDIRDTRPEPATGLGGRGCSFDRYAGAATGAVAQLAGSVLENNHEVTLFVSASQVSLAGLSIRDTKVAPGGLGGRGICVQVQPDSGAPASLTATGSVVEDHFEFGVVFFGADGVLDGLAIRRTGENPTEGLFGDGLSAIGIVLPSNVHVANSEIRDHARAGLSNFGASVGLVNTALRCSSIDMAGEAYEGPFAYDDQGGNSCGCPEGGPCKAVSSQLAPPSAL